MNQVEFENRLSQCTEETDIAVLADEVFEEINEGMDVALAKSFVQQLLKKGLNPAAQPYENDPWLCINGLAYAYKDEVLDIARMIFEKCGVPKAFYSFIGTKVDFDCYNVPYVVKLYLLASAYLWETETTYIKMSENLYEEMFTSYCYTSLRENHKKLTLTPAIFKEIEKFDFSVEMLEQINCKLGRMVIHIFEKESKIEVARYE